MRPHWQMDIHDCHFSSYEQYLQIRRQMPLRRQLATVEKSLVALPNSFVR